MSMKRIVIFGASGKLGQNFCHYSLEKGYETVAVDKIHSNNDNLINEQNLIEKRGDVKDYLFLKSLLKNGDRIVYSVRNKKNKTWTNDTSSGILNIIKTSEQISISRLIYVGGAGILKAKNGALRGEQHIPTDIKLLYKEHLKSYNLLREGNLDWTIICPPRMGDMKKNKEIRWKINYLPKNSRPISYRAVAKFAVDIIESSKLSKKRIGICF
ncbi:MAG: NAD(P)H-binding protein [Candidatus Lokiarchaeota archaeon]|nr:NAD(P)H-binding protein [Candidatus Lokiarchaeota archaeon]